MQWHSHVDQYISKTVMKKQIRGETCTALFQSLNHIEASPPNHQVFKVPFYNTDSWKSPCDSTNLHKKQTGNRADFKWQLLNSYKPKHFVVQTQHRDSCTPIQRVENRFVVCHISIVAFILFKFTVMWMMLNYIIHIIIHINSRVLLKSTQRIHLMHVDFVKNPPDLC